MKTTPRKKKTVVFRLRMSEQARKELSQVAAALDVSDSEYVRKALFEAVRRDLRKLLAH